MRAGTLSLIHGVPSPVGLARRRAARGPRVAVAARLGATAGERGYSGGVSPHSRPAAVREYANIT